MQYFPRWFETLPWAFSIHTRTCTHPSKIINKKAKKKKPTTTITKKPTHMHKEHYLIMSFLPPGQPNWNIFFNLCAIMSLNAGLCTRCEWMYLTLNNYLILKGYYARSDSYFPMLQREEKGCFEVPMIHSTMLIDLRKTISDQLRYNPPLPSYHGEEDDILVFAHSAREAG